MNALRNTANYMPEYKGYLRQVDEDEKLRQCILIHALNTYGFHIPVMTVFKLDYLGMLIRMYYALDNPRTVLISDLCLINGDAVCPIQRLADGSFSNL